MRTLIAMIAVLVLASGAFAQLAYDEDFTSMSPGDPTGFFDADDNELLMADWSPQPDGTPTGTAVFGEDSWTDYTRDLATGVNAADPNRVLVVRNTPMFENDSLASFENHVFELALLDDTDTGLNLRYGSRGTSATEGTIWLRAIDEGSGVDLGAFQESDVNQRWVSRDNTDVGRAMALHAYQAFDSETHMVFRPGDTSGTDYNVENVYTLYEQDPDTGDFINPFRSVGRDWDITTPAGVALGNVSSLTYGSKARGTLQGMADLTVGSFHKSDVLMTGTVTASDAGQVLGNIGKTDAVWLDGDITNTGGVTASDAGEVLGAIGATQADLDPETQVLEYVAGTGELILKGLPDGTGTLAAYSLFSDGQFLDGNWTGPWLEPGVSTVNADELAETWVGSFTPGDSAWDFETDGPINLGAVLPAELTLPEVEEVLTRNKYTPSVGGGTIDLQIVPEPATLALLGLGGLGALIRKRR